MRKMAKFSIAPELLIDAFHMPEDTVICGAEWNFEMQRIELFVSHMKRKKSKRKIGGKRK